MRMKKVSVLLALPLTFIACSKDGSGLGVGGSIGGFGSTIESQFIDAPVKGLSFKTDSNAGDKTGAAGKFSCKRGEQVTFSLAGLDLGSAACGSKIFVQDLHSVKPDYTWQQAAAVIQSFAPLVGTELDLTEVNALNLDLSTVDYSPTGAIDQRAAFITAHAETAVMANPPSVVTHVNAATAAQAAVIESAEATPGYSYLSAVLAELADETATTPIKLTATLVSGTIVNGEQECWAKMTADAKVTKVTASGKDIYSFEVNKVVSFDSASDLEQDGTCGDNSGDSCEQYDQVAAGQPNYGRIPLPKVITSRNLNVSSNWSASAQEGTLVQNGSLSLDMTNTGALDGVYSEKQVITPTGEASYTVSCRYNISSSAVLEEAPGESGDEDGEDEDDGGAGSWSGPVTCTGGDLNRAPEDGPITDSEFFTVSLSVIEDSSPEGYSAIGLTIADDAGVPFPDLPSPLALVNDTQTPDDVPFLQYSQTIENSVWHLGGYNNWSGDVNSTYHFSITRDGGDGYICEGDLAKI